MEIYGLNMSKNMEQKRKTQYLFLPSFYYGETIYDGSTHKLCLFRTYIQVQLHLVSTKVPYINNE